MDPPLCPRSLPELLVNTPAGITWLWEGYLARGGVTLLTSRWKAGKTTLLAVLLARLEQGGELAGQAVRPARAVVLTEEDALLWGQRGQALPLRDQVCWLCRPFPGKPTSTQWHHVLDTLLDLRGKVGVDLFVVDPLAMFLPAQENDAAGLLQALAPLRTLTEAGLAVLLLHHPRKGSSAAGTAARGSGALGGFADVLIEMDYCERAGPDDRRRRLQAWSRFPGTPRQLTVERSLDGTDYRAVPDPEAEAGASLPEGLRLVLEGVTGKVTRRQIHEGWLPDFLPRPDGSTLTRWLSQAVASGRVRREGSGRRNDAYRYWLPGREKVRDQEQVHRLIEVLEEQTRRAREMLPPEVRPPGGPNEPNE